MIEISLDAKCAKNEDCPSQLACVNQQCANPCTLNNPCDSNEECQMDQHEPQCLKSKIYFLIH